MTPDDIAAKALFLSDRTCCVCRDKGKPVQIHHIDEDTSNNDMKNLAVLCLECHDDTQISGGFGRKLNAEQVTLYRDDWLTLVARQRWAGFVDVEEKSGSSVDIELITSTLEILRENKQYELVAVHYSIIGNAELRDKYIEIVLKQKHSDETEIFLRSLQGKVELVDQKKIQKEISRRKAQKNWSELARLFVDTKDWENAIRYYFKSICEDLEHGNTFAAAFYLKELTKEELHKPLFEKAYKEFIDKKDLWWQIRSLQELGWRSELEALLLRNQRKIEKSGDLNLLELLYQTTGEREKLLETQKRLADSMKVEQ